MDTESMANLSDDATTRIKLDSVSYFTENYMTSRCEEGNTIMLSAQTGSHHIAFAVDEWPEIQAVINAAIAGFKSIQEDER